MADIVREFRLDPPDDCLARNAGSWDAWRQGESIPALMPNYVG